MYKTIVVHVDRSDTSVLRIDLAARLSLKYEAHLVGAAMTGVKPAVFPVGGFDIAPPALPFPLDELRAMADQALDAFDARARSAGVLSFERRRLDDEPGFGLAMQSRYCDLIVIGQAAQDSVLPRLRSDTPEYVLLNCVCPVLVLPSAGPAGGIGNRVTVGWNGSANAARAIMSAIPVLREAELVDLVVYSADADMEMHGEQPGADMAAYLARHGVKVELTARDASSDAGNALLAHAANHGSDLIVMGAFGHSRFRELVFGGATRSALSASTLPLWMAH